MMSVETIIDLARRAAFVAAEQQAEPYNPTSPDECSRWSRFPFPNLGSYRPADWRLIEFVTADSSGLGAEWEPALTIRGLKAWCAERVEKDPTAGFAVIESGQFQVVVGYFTQDETIEVIDEAYGDTEEELQGAFERCWNCGELCDPDTVICPECDDELIDLGFGE